MFFWVCVSSKAVVGLVELSDSLTVTAAALDRLLSRMFSGLHLASQSARCFRSFAVALLVGGPGGTSSASDTDFESMLDSG